jgi:hypothetical protein
MGKFYIGIMKGDRGVIMKMASIFGVTKDRVETCSKLRPYLMIAPGMESYLHKGTGGFYVQTFKRESAFFSTLSQEFSHS